MAALEDLIYKIRSRLTFYDGITTDIELLSEDMLSKVIDSGFLDYLFACELELLLALWIRPNQKDNRMISEVMKRVVDGQFTPKTRVKVCWCLFYKLWRDSTHLLEVEISISCGSGEFAQEFWDVISEDFLKIIKLTRSSASKDLGMICGYNKYLEVGGGDFYDFEEKITEVFSRVSEEINSKTLSEIL